MQTLANIAGAKYGRTDIDTYTLIMKNDYTSGSYPTSTGNCMDYFRANDYNNRLSKTSNVICVDGDIPSGANSSVASIEGYFWSSSELNDSRALQRHIFSEYSIWNDNNRSYSTNIPLCVGD